MIEKCNSVKTQTKKKNNIIIHFLIEKKFIFPVS